jgi:hypothetical protein
MFPLITEKYTRGEKTHGILKKSILYAGTLSGCLILIYFYYPQIVVKIFGDKYFNAIDMVAPYGLAMFFVSITSIIMSFHLAIKNIRYIGFFAGFTIIEVVLLMIFNSSMAGMINVMLITNFLFMAISIIYTLNIKEDEMKKVLIITNLPSKETG